MKERLVLDPPASTMPILATRNHLIIIDAFSLDSPDT